MRSVAALAGMAVRMIAAVAVTAAMTVVMSAIVAAAVVMMTAVAPGAVMMTMHPMPAMHGVGFRRVGDRLHLGQGGPGRQSQGRGGRRGEKSLHGVLPRVCPPWKEPRPGRGAWLSLAIA